MNKVYDYKERISICRSCEHLNPIFVQCKKCGCFLKFKARMKGEDCPDGRWTEKNLPKT